uniref:Uncharacterized protein n=1 Tax=Magnetococcus massalia (strain MO-1) TaxID=451514 RepID=A0A1S7LJE2_MAGMO|nr:protein of unknown function [Candidatus Magnetococcus massalia]
MSDKLSCYGAAHREMGATDAKIQLPRPSPAIPFGHGPINNLSRQDRHLRSPLSYREPCNRGFAE